MVETGAYYVNADVTDVLTDEPEFKKVWNFHTDLLTDYQLFSPGYLPAGFAELQNFFTREQVTMMVSGPWTTDYIKNDNPDMEYGIFQLPHPSREHTGSVVVGWQFGIWKDAKHKEAAWKLLEYICKPQNAALFAEDTNLPWLKEARNYPPFSNDPILKEFMGIMSYARFHLSPIAEISEIAENLHRELQNVIYDKKDAIKHYRTIQKYLKNYFLQNN